MTDSKLEKDSSIAYGAAMPDTSQVPCVPGLPSVPTQERLAQIRSRMISNRDGTTTLSDADVIWMLNEIVLAPIRELIAKDEFVEGSGINVAVAKTHLSATEVLAYQIENDFVRAFLANAEELDNLAKTGGSHEYPIMAKTYRQAADDVRVYFENLKHKEQHREQDVPGVSEGQQADPETPRSGT